MRLSLSTHPLSCMTSGHSEAGVQLVETNPSMKTGNREFGHGQIFRAPAGVGESRCFILLLLGVLFSGVLPAVAQFGMLLHPTNTLWSVWSNGTNPGYGLVPGSPDWAQPNFDDTAWPKGLGLFGNDFGYPYPFQTITPPPSVATRFYARTHFNWNGNIHGVTLRGTNFVDDGAVVYLNGVEIYRINMPAGPTTFETLAPGTFAEPIMIPVFLSLDALTNGNANPLVIGDNVIAVETASNSQASSDTVWGLSLYSSSEPCHPLANVTPARPNVLECRSVTLAATFAYLCPGLSSYQWYRNVGQGEELIPGSTGTTLTITSVEAGDAGEYYLRTTTTAGAVDSSHSVLIVTPDSAAPVIVSAEAEASGSILVRFDEPFLPVARGGTADDVRTWLIRSTSGEDVSVVSALANASNPTEVRLTLGTAFLPGRAYEYVTTSPIADACTGAPLPAGQTGAVRFRANLVHWTDGRDWRYDQSGLDRGTAWREFGYDDSSWEHGPQGFGNETDGFPDAPDSQRTPLLVGSSRVTYYFRTRFSVPDDASDLLFRAAVDDGAVIYVNGTEIGRINMPPFPFTVNFSTIVPSISEGQGYLPAAGFLVPAQLLRTGENVLAVEVHQDSFFGTDVLLLASLTGSVRTYENSLTILTQPRSLSIVEGRPFAVGITTIAANASYQWFKDGTPIPGATSPTYSAVADGSSAGVYRVAVSNSSASVTSDPATVIVRRLVKSYVGNWKYRIESQDFTLAGTPWYAIGFDDSSWASAPGPFGVETTASTLERIPAITTPLPAPSSNLLTTYFRSTIDVPAISAGESLFLNHVIDDGAAFYVDGDLAFTYNFSVGEPIRFGTLTPTAVQIDGDAREITVPIALPAGLHTLAVEVHQASPTSSDVVFGVEITRGPAFPRLNIGYAAPNVVRVTWAPAIGVHLYSALSATGVFTMVSGDPQGSLVMKIPADGLVRFYRLGY